MCVIIEMAIQTNRLMFCVVVVVVVIAVAVAVEWLLTLNSPPHTMLKNTCCHFKTRKTYFRYKLIYKTLF